MEANQVVSNKTWLLEYDPSTSVDDVDLPSVQTYYNNQVLSIRSPERIESWKVHSIGGQICDLGGPSMGTVNLPVSLSPGLYIVSVRLESGAAKSTKIAVSD